MGERLVREAGFEPIRVVDPFDGATPDPTETTADHTARVVEAFVAGDDPVDLVLFVGGDGTATDVATVLERTGAEIPMLGVPAGVKVCTRPCSPSRPRTPRRSRRPSPAPSAAR